MRMPMVEIEKACAVEDSTRPYLHTPWLFVAQAKIVASNGAIMAAVPVEVEDGDVDGPVPLAALKAARKFAGRMYEEMVIECGPESCITPDGVAYPRDFNVGNFPPQWEKYFPVPDDELPDFVLNAALLETLAKALTVPERKKREFDHPKHGVALWCGRRGDGSLDITKAIRVETHALGAVGVIMPQRWTAR